MDSLRQVSSQERDESKGHNALAGASHSALGEAVSLILGLLDYLSGFGDNRRDVFRNEIASFHGNTCGSPVNAAIGAVLRW